MNYLALAGLLAMVAKYLHGKDKPVYKHRAPADIKQQFKGEANE